MPRLVAADLTSGQLPAVPDSLPSAIQRITDGSVNINTMLC